MTTIELKWNKKLTKTIYNDIEELSLDLHFIKFKRRKKLTPNEIIKKYNLNKTYNWKKVDITKEIDKITYNI